MDKEKGESNEVRNNGENKIIWTFEKPENTKEDDRLQDTAFSDKENPAVDEVTPDLLETMGKKVEVPGQETENVVKGRKNSGKDHPEKAISVRKLTQIVTDDGQEDTAFFLKGLNAYGSQDWSGAIENLTHLIKTYPTGKYIERAYFLLAESYERLHSQSISVHFKEIKNHYEDAINRFPASEFVPDAFFAIGNLYFKIENYFEALGYYNLVLKKDKDSILTLKALTQKVRIFLLKKKREEALSVSSVLEDFVSMFSDIPERTEAKKEISKVLYEVNNFQKSLNILSELRTTNPDNIYKYPEISLYCSLRKHVFIEM